MSYYPLFLDLTGRTCIVIGGGRVAQRKVRALLSCGARVKVVSPRISKGVGALRDRNGVELHERPYKTADLEDAALAFAATNDAGINKRVQRDAQKKRILVNVADSPDLCDFIVPSTVKRGPVVIAISTSGMLPMLSKRLRQEMVERLSKDYERYAVKVGKLRRLLMEKVADRKKRLKVLRQIDKMAISEIAALSMKELRERFLRAKQKS